MSETLIRAMKCPNCGAEIRGLIDSHNRYWGLPLIATESDLAKKMPCDTCGLDQFTVSELVSDSKPWTPRLQAMYEGVFGPRSSWLGMRGLE